MRAAVLLLGLVCIAGGAEPPGPIPHPLNRYEALWARPMFAPAQDSPEPQGGPAPKRPLFLAGWGRIGHRDLVIALDPGTGRPVVFERGVGPEQDQLLRLQPARGQTSARALIHWNGDEVWISHQPGSVPLLPAVEVDSRAAHLRGPVILTEGATMEMLVSPQTRPSNSRTSRK